MATRKNKKTKNMRKKRIKKNKIEEIQDPYGKKKIENKTN